MGTDRDDVRAAGLAASSEGRKAEAYRLLLPLAEAGDAEAQSFVGSLMQFSLHRLENTESLKEIELPVTDEATALADQEQAGRFLQAASDAGIGHATFNLAGMVVGGYGGGSWEERKARAAELYALAYNQGFTAFGWLMQGASPGQPYFDILERHAGEGPLPGESKPGV